MPMPIFKNGIGSAPENCGSEPFTARHLPRKWLAAKNAVSA